MQSNLTYLGNVGPNGVRNSEKSVTQEYSMHNTSTVYGYNYRFVILVSEFFSWKVRDVGSNFIDQITDLLLYMLLNLIH